MPKNQAPCHGMNFLRFMKLEYKAYQRGKYNQDPILETFYKCGIIISDIRIFNTIKNYLASYDHYKGNSFKEQYVTYKKMVHDNIKQFARVMPRLARAARKQGKYVDINYVWGRIAYNRPSTSPGKPLSVDLRGIKFKLLYHIEKRVSYYFSSEDDATAQNNYPHYPNLNYLPKKVEIKIVGPNGRV